MLLYFVVGKLQYTKKFALPNPRRKAFQFVVVQAKMLQPLKIGNAAWQGFQIVCSEL